MSTASCARPYYDDEGSRNAFETHTRILKRTRTCKIEHNSHRLYCHTLRNTQNTCNTQTMHNNSNTVTTHTWYRMTTATADAAICGRHLNQFPLPGVVPKNCDRILQCHDGFTARLQASHSFLPTEALTLRVLAGSQRYPHSQGPVQTCTRTSVNLPTNSVGWHDLPLSRVQLRLHSGRRGTQPVATAAEWAAPRVLACM